MKKTTSLFYAICLTALVLLLANCEQDGPVEKAGEKVDQTLEEAGKKIEKAGEAISDQAENAAGALDDSAITAKIKAAILEDSLLKVLEIEVITEAGAVQLNGMVTSQENIARAEEIAAGVQGVKSVENNLVVKSD
jgi:hyperosmotically inducible periplasmic protein